MNTHPTVVRLTALALLLSLVPAARAEEPLFRSAAVKLGVQPEFIAGGDLDGDGDTDLVSTTTANSIIVSLNTGGGTWANQPAISVGPLLNHIAIGDLNDDGVPDLAYAVDAPTFEVLVVRLGDGTGAFGGPLLSVTSPGPFDLDLADLDGDGDLDAVLACTVSQRVSVLLGDGDGTFAPKVDYAAGDSPLNVAAGDWNGDDAPDFAVADNSNIAGERAVTVLLNNGDGTYGAPSTIAMPAQVFDIEAGDFDADGELDLAVSQLGGADVLVLFGNGDGSFEPIQSVPANVNPRMLQVADVDEDGDDDILAASLLAPTTVVGVMLSGGDRSFEAPALYGTFGQPVDLTVLDVNDDGDADLAVPCNEFIFGQSFTLLQGNGLGAFHPNAGIAGDNPSDVALADLDADGRQDMVANSVLNDRVSVFPGAGNGFFGRAESVSVNSFPGQGARSLSVSLGDLDGDGAQDILAGADKGAGEILVFFGNGDLSFDPFVALAVSGNPTDLAAVDLDDDDDLDLIATGSTNDTLMILRNLGGGTFAAPDLYATADVPFRLATARMNADTFLDVVVTTGGFTGNNVVHVFLGNGNGTVQPALTFAGGINHGSIAVGDADGDTDTDVLVGLAQFSGLLLLSNDGNGFLSAPAMLSNGTTTSSGVVLADLDRDGLTDIAAAGGFTLPTTGLGTVAFLRGTGGGSFAAAEFFEAASGTQGLLAHDIDGDGALDLAAPVLYDFVHLLMNQLGPWNDLGSPLAGGLGLPKQVGEGSLQSGQPFRFTLSDSRPSAPVAHVVGLSAINAPFKGGVFVPLPALINFPLVTDATGDLVLAGPWPPGAGGLTLYLQFWFQDPAGPVGYAASNAVSAVIPLP